jgi:DNA-binding Lrp family transcriptional regulator
MIDDSEKKVIAMTQGDLPLDPHPFAIAGERAGMSEEEFISRIRDLKERGVIRRFGATLRHQEAGFSSNAMVAWIVDEERVEEVGRILAGFKEVTHCYERVPRPDKGWAYNVYTMIHGDNRDVCVRIAARMAKKIGVEQYTLLFSEKEFKKTSMEYF